MSVGTGIIELIKGRNLSIGITFRYGDGSPINLTGAKIWFTVKNDICLDDEDATILKRSLAAGGAESQINIDDAVHGHCLALIVPGDSTNDAVGYGSYYFDISIELAGKKKTPIIGTFNIVTPVNKNLSTGT